MAELGTESSILHQKIGQKAQKITPHVYSVGTLAKHYQAWHFDSKAQLAKHISKNHMGATLLIKGSRIAKLDELVTLLQK
jgi:UDP-N-acetylmuramoyl-tripeptide--D-alanyl-D-alanine ligase